MLHDNCHQKQLLKDVAGDHSSDALQDCCAGRLRVEERGLQERGLVNEADLGYKRKKNTGRRGRGLVATCCGAGNGTALQKRSSQFTGLCSWKDAPEGWRWRPAGVGTCRRG